MLVHIQRAVAGLVQKVSNSLMQVIPSQITIKISSSSLKNLIGHFLLISLVNVSVKHLKGKF